MRTRRCGGCLFRRVWIAMLLAAALTVIALCVAGAQDSPHPGAPAQGAPSAAQPPAVQPVPQQAAGSQTVVPPAPQGVPDVFESRIPTDQMAFLSGLAGASSNDVIRNKQFKKLMKLFVPSCEFHYGRDMGLDDALQMVIQGSRAPAQIWEGRYFTISGANGPYLAGRAMLWIDMKEGIALGTFYFHPTNGEPTPTVAVSSRQVKRKALGMYDLPEAFAEDLNVWAQGSHVPVLTTRYFLTGGNMRVLLEHDEEFCLGANLSLVPAGERCEQMDADAADLDETAAYYLDQVHYRTNATAWMIGPDQVAWLGVRERTCGGVADPLGCRIRVTREHTRGLTGRPAPRPRPVSGGRR